MSTCWKGWRGSSRASASESRLPAYVSLSTFTTCRSELQTTSRTTADPMKPAPPVLRIFMVSDSASPPWSLVNTPSNQPLRHIPKAPATLGKLSEGPFRHYLPLLQQYNPVTVPYRAQAVGDDDYRLLRAETLDGLHDCPLCDGVQGAGCFIKDQYGRVVVEGAGYSDALSLPTG